MSQTIFNNLIAGNWDTLPIYFSKTSLVDKFPNGLQVRVTPCNVGLTNSQHVDGGFVQLDKHTIVDLEQTEQLEDLAYLGCHFNNTKKVFLQYYEN